jgi:hypothetical protein
MNITQKSCPVCSNNIFDTLIDFGQIPHSGTFLSHPDEKSLHIHLAFEYCRNCALIRQRPCDQSCPDYGNVNRSTQGQMPAYINDIIEHLKNESQYTSRLVLDIGGNDGAFMDRLALAGCENRLIIEPSVRLAEKCREKGHAVENIHFNVIEAERLRKYYGPAKVIFCRHVLEHVPDPEDFFRAVQMMTAEDGLVFLETPDAQGISERLLGHELWDEHLYYYTERHLSCLAGRFGYTVEWRAVKPHRGGTNLLLWVTPGKLNSPLTFKSAEKDLTLCRSFKDRWVNYCRILRERARNWPRPVACMGASHPQSNYALFTEIGSWIDFMVDDDPVKIGSFVPLPEATPVISTEQLFKHKDVGTLLLTAFGRADWINKATQTLSTRGVRFIDPYPVPFKR